MENFKEYTKLDIWVKNREMAKAIYEISNYFPDTEMFGLTSQIRRSAVSVPSNIAEGIGRQHLKEKMHFLHIARGSLFELETQLYLSFDFKYVKIDELNEILELVSNCKMLINGFIRYLKK